MNAEDAALVPALDRLVRQLAAIGIEQFVTTSGSLEALERSVCTANLDLGFTLLLGGDVPACRMPTAVLIGDPTQKQETLRTHCLDLRRRFETWPEVPILFVLFHSLTDLGALSQYLSSHAPISERELQRTGSSV